MSEKKPTRKAGRRSLHAVVLRLCPNCNDLTAEPVGSIDQHTPNFKGGWKTRTIMQMWECKNCGHDFAEWKPQNAESSRRQK